MSLWTRRSDRAIARTPEKSSRTPHKASEGQVIHSYLRTLESVSAGLQRLGVPRNAADRGGLYAAFRLEGYTKNESLEVVDRILPRKAEQPSGELESSETN